MFDRATDKTAKYLAKKYKPFFYGDRELTEQESKLKQQQDKK